MCWTDAKLAPSPSTRGTQLLWVKNWGEHVCDWLLAPWCPGLGLAMPSSGDFCHVESGHAGLDRVPFLSLLCPVIACVFCGLSDQN